VAALLSFTALASLGRAQSALDGFDPNANGRILAVALNATNFRSDFTVNGAIDSGDAITVRARSGDSIP